MEFRLMTDKYRNSAQPQGRRMRAAAVEDYNVSADKLNVNK